MDLLHFKVEQSKLMKFAKIFWSGCVWSPGSPSIWPRINQPMTVSDSSESLDSKNVQENEI